jgi:hydrogenase maturation protease
VKILVCGYGNPYRTDDGVGHHLAPLLAQWLGSIGQDAGLYLDHQLLPELAEDLRGYDLAVFVDARVPSGAEEGFHVSDVHPERELEGLNMHSVGPEWILHLVDALGAPVPPSVLVSVDGESFDFGDELTPCCRTRMDRAADSFRRWFSERYL